MLAAFFRRLFDSFVHMLNNFNTLCIWTSYSNCFIRVLSFESMIGPLCLLELLFLSIK